MYSTMKYDAGHVLATLNYIDNISISLKEPVISNYFTYHHGVWDDQQDMIGDAILVLSKKAKMETERYLTTTLSV